MAELTAQTDTTVQAPPAPPMAASTAAAGAAPADAQLVEADLLVEEVSIDGMCGVY